MTPSWKTLPPSSASGGVSVLSYGADPSGLTDSTAAFNLALAASQLVNVPAGTYLIAAGNLAVPATKELRGVRTRTYTTAPASGSVLKVTDPAVTGAVVALGAGARLTDIVVIGAGQSAATQHDGVSGSQGCAIDSCFIGLCKTGVAANYHSVYLTRTSIFSNQAEGVKNPVDGQISNCIINVNTGHGINLQSGANDNRIVNNKIEWNTATGIKMVSAKHNTVVGCIFDRNGAAGVDMVGAQGCSIVGNVLRRNGAQSSGVANGDTHFYAQDLVNCTFNGNTTESGADDDGGNYNSPVVTVRQQAGTNVTWNGNFLAGCISAAPVTTVSSGTNVRYVGNVGTVNQNQGTAGRRSIRQQALGYTDSVWDITQQWAATGVVTPASQQMYATLAGFYAGDVVSNIFVALSTLGVGTPPTGLYLVLYDRATGALLGSTGNIASSSIWTAAVRIVSAPLVTPYTIPKDGGYYLGILQNGTWGTTALTIKGSTSNLQSFLTSPANGMGALLNVKQAGQATPPDPATYAGDGTNVWFGWS